MIEAVTRLMLEELLQGASHISHIDQAAVLIEK
jgi:hypothetical protein